MYKTGSPTAGLFGATTEPHDSLHESRRATGDIQLNCEFFLNVACWSWAMVDAELSAVTSWVCFWLGLVLIRDSQLYLFSEYKVWYRAGVEKFKGNVYRIKTKEWVRLFCASRVKWQFTSKNVWVTCEELLLKPLMTLFKARSHLPLCV